LRRVWQYDPLSPTQFFQGPVLEGHALASRSDDSTEEMRAGCGWPENSLGIARLTDFGGILGPGPSPAHVLPPLDSPESLKFCYPPR
jgi:hypothetical protein